MPFSSPRFGFVTALALSATFALACAEAKPPTTSVAGAPTATPPSKPTSDAVPTTKPSSNVYISDEIRTRCGIPDADAYFAFDSASVTTLDRTPLDLVARCFISGPLHGRALKLVGRADPRGSSDYNLTLGQWRADAVEGYLASRGLGKSKATTTSRGAMDATGSDETGWQHDRRVDIMLAQ